MYYNPRCYDPNLGRFVQADTLIPGVGNPMAWDRFAYVSNNPLRYIDPSGHRICEDTENCGPNQEDVYGAPYPWESDDSKDNWGDETGSDHDLREEMAGKVWDWLPKEGNYWWGEGELDAYDLIAWLLWQEMAEILSDAVYYPNGINNPAAYDAIRASIGYMYRIFSDEDGISPKDLSTFTAFYNPERDGAFDQKDWDLLMTKPTDTFYNTVDYFWGYSDPGLVVWRDPNLQNEPTFNTEIAIVIHPVSNEVILEFGYK
jgi:hypothetical protein